MTRDPNELAKDFERRERYAPDSVHTPRRGRLIGAVIDIASDNPPVDEDGQVVWFDVVVSINPNGLLVAEDSDGLRIIVNPQAYLFLEFRPNREGE